jgi:ubiquinone/menaquinone biosynthesis C-methylase UbiE
MAEMTVENQIVYCSNQIIPKARKNIHKAVLAWFEKQKPGSVLDAPAGHGHLSLSLRDIGYEVTAGEIEPEIFSASGIKCIYTDLNRHINAPDNSFDYICCVDGLEHMTDPYQAVKEFARVLKPEGYGVFSIPNYTNIERRLKFLFRGYFTKPISYERFQREGANLFNFHNSPITITILEFMFKINRLAVVEIRENAPKVKQYLFLPFVILLWMINHCRTHAKKTEHRTDLTLDKHIILGGNNLIIITRKI